MFFYLFKKKLKKFFFSHVRWVGYELHALGQILHLTGQIMTKLINFEECDILAQAKNLTINGILDLTSLGCTCHSCTINIQFKDSHGYKDRLSNYTMLCYINQQDSRDSKQCFFVAGFGSDILRKRL